MQASLFTKAAPIIALSLTVWLAIATVLPRVISLIESISGSCFVFVLINFAGDRVLQFVPVLTSAKSVSFGQQWLKGVKFSGWPISTPSTWNRNEQEEGEIKSTIDGEIIV
jgi:hypothetical protein